MNSNETIMVIDESCWRVWKYKCSKKKRNIHIRSCWHMLRTFWNKKFWHRKWQFFQSFWCIIKNIDKNKMYSNCKCMMVTTILYMVSIKSSRLSKPYNLYMISIKSSRLSELYVPIQWLPLVNSWNLWNYTLTDIFNHFNCIISITISPNIASKGQ